MAKIINWKTVAGACIAAGAFVVRWLVTHSIPEELKSADSFTAINLKWAGIANPPAALVSQAADHWILIGATILLTAGFGLFAWGVMPWVRSRKAQKSLAHPIEQTAEAPPQSDIGARVVIESTIFEPDPDDATWRIVKVEVRNMGPGPAYSGSCSSSYLPRDGMDEYPEADIDNTLTAVLDYVRSAAINRAVSYESGQATVFQMNDRIAEDTWQDVIHGRATLYIWTAYAYLDDNTIGDEIRVAHRVMRYHSGNGDGMAGTLIHQATRTLRAKKQ